MTGKARTTSPTPRPVSGDTNTNTYNTTFHTTTATYDGQVRRRRTTTPRLVTDKPPTWTMQWKPTIFFVLNFDADGRHAVDHAVELHHSSPTSTPTGETTMRGARRGAASAAPCFRQVWHEMLWTKVALLPVARRVSGKSGTKFFLETPTEVSYSRGAGSDGEAAYPDTLACRPAHIP